MTARINAPKTGGRKRGSLDREQRKVLTDKMAADLMYCYGKLGGRTWLLEFAKENPGEFIRQGLSRLWPAPQKSDDGDFAVQNNQYNVSTMSPVEVARNVAFALNLGLHLAEQEQQVVADITPEPITSQRADWQPPVMPPLVHPEPEPEPDPEREKWVSELSLTPEERADKKLIRETKEATLANYRGNTAEQGGTVHQPGSCGGKASASELCFRLSRRGRDLL